MKIIILGLSITSSWGNGHATTFRGLVRGLVARGHEVHFLERDVPWYAGHRDLCELPGAQISLYRSVEGLVFHREAIRNADAVIVGSYVPDGALVGEWVLTHAGGVVAFYDIDTPVTLAALRRGECPYLTDSLVARYPLYLSFTGGPTLRQLEDEWRSPSARPLYCAVDPTLYFPETTDVQWALGYLGTYSADRQTALKKLMLDVADRLPSKRFVVAGAQYPASVSWPGNVDRIEHCPPGAHRDFYNRQRFTLNLTRADMRASGYSPSVRLFEAAACGVPVISDDWPGLEEFFTPGEEILVAQNGDDVRRFLTEISPDDARRIGLAARDRVLKRHTASHRAAELEAYLIEAGNATATAASAEFSMHP
jgi:spore maturation protein CgeB